MAFYKNIPFVKQYYLDGERLFQVADHGFNVTEKGINALIPYADILGFQGEGSFTGGTTQDRIVLILETLKEFNPQ